MCMCIKGITRFSSFKFNLQILQNMCLLRWKCTQCNAKFYTRELLDMHISIFHLKSFQNEVITHNESQIEQVSVESDVIEQEEKERLERKFAHLKVVQKFYSAPECSEEQKLDEQDDAAYILVVQDKKIINDNQLERSTLNILTMNEDPCQDEKDIAGSNVECKHLNDMLTMTMKEPTLVIEGIQRNDGYVNGYNSMSMIEFKCKRCDEIFNTKHERRLHMESHAKDLRYFCTVCGRGFRKNQGLQLHMNVHASGSNHQCPHCLNYYRTDRYLKEHMKLHIPEEYKFTCRVCNKSFAHKTAFKYHMHSHYSILKFICNICGKGYRQKASLEAHLRLHRGERPYVCQACGAAFRTKHTLGDHEKLHTGARPFVCDWRGCDKAYTLKAQLRTHKLRHSRQKLHVCTQPGCTKRFFYESHRVRHEKTSHDAITEEITYVKPLI